MDNFNKLEFSIFSYLIENKEAVSQQTISEVSQELHVSSSMITKVCQKMGYTGFLEYKASLKYEDKVLPRKHVDGGYDLLIHYFNSLKSTDFFDRIEQAAYIIEKARLTVFVGIGLSGYLGEYASQLFTRNGIASVSVNDFTAQLNGVYNSEDVAIVLSVSGETKEVNKQILTFKKEGLTVVVVSNTENNTAAHLADFVISYYVPNHIDEVHYNSATQVPVLFILESLVKKVRVLKGGTDE